MWHAECLPRSAGHVWARAFVRAYIWHSAWDKHRCPQQRASVSLEISTASMLQLFQSDASLSPAARINFLPMAAGRSWQPALSKACQTRGSWEDARGQEGRGFYPSSRPLTTSREHPLCSEKQGACSVSCSVVYFKLRAVFVYVQS